ncbi:MAG: hypothetical protein J6I42_04225 [Clostridia bacterium]|nr:hypothetical protein [Clostridia bacterium]
MTTKKRSLIALLLALSMLTVPSCGESAANSDDPTAPSAEVTDPAAEAETEEQLYAAEALAAIPDSLPEKDMDGWQFRMTIFGTDQTRAETYAEEATGNVVNDAVYKKILNVEERFNVDVALTETSLASVDSVDVLKQAIVAGDDSCELAQGHDISMANAALQAYFYDVYKIPHLDFEKPWWPEATLESMTVLGQMYMMFNNISYVNLEATRVMFLNKTLMDDMNIAHPYDTVYEGKWTLDELQTLSDSAYLDLNGDGNRDPDDQYGFVSPTYFYCCMEPFNLEPYCKDADGNLYYSLDVERTSALVEKYYNLLFGQGGLKTDYDTITKVFTDGRAMFYYATLNEAVNKFSDSDVVYGILPMPKLEESQDQYYGGSTDRPIAVPITVQTTNMDNLGIVVEALNAEGYKNVYPAFYEIAMKNRYADQTDDAKMLDLVHGNVIISFTYLYGNYASAYNILFENLFNAATPNTDVASWAAKNEKVQNKYVERLQKFFTEQLTAANP